MEAPVISHYRKAFSCFPNCLSYVKGHALFWLQMRQMYWLLLNHYIFWTFRFRATGSHLTQQWAHANDFFPSLKIQFSLQNLQVVCVSAHVISPPLFGLCIWLINSICYRRVMLNKATVLESHVLDCHPHTSITIAPMEVLWSHNLEAKQQKLISKLLRSFNRPMEKATRYMSAKYCSHLHNKLETRIWIEERQLRELDSIKFASVLIFLFALPAKEMFIFVLCN